MASTRIALRVFAMAALCSACSGGSNSDDSPDSPPVPPANRAPVVARPNSYQFVSVGTSLNYDATQGGTTFADEDVRSLIYHVSLLSSPRGLTVNGTRVTGAFQSVGLVQVSITATDPHGESVEDTFAIVAPAPEPGRPGLPVTMFTYDDAKLDLPYWFRFSREQIIPFWDTTPLDNPTTDAGATLGRVLFYDKRLSITNTASCGSCHQQARGFASPEKFSEGFQGEHTKRNAMGLTNVRYNLRNLYFSDVRARTLEALVPMPIEDPAELGNSLSLLEAKLTATDFYPPLFQAAFGTAEINRDRIAKALAQFLRSLISYRSKFDQAYSELDDPSDPPDPAATLSSEELRGAEVFVLGLCGHCHGSAVHTNIDPANNGLDVDFMDAGAGFGAFRVASLRNVGVSAPYMHDGRFATLREVIDHYDSGVKDSPFLSAILRDLQAEAPLPLNLSEEDKNALEAFLHTLTDEQLLTDPRFSDPFQ